MASFEERLTALDWSKLHHAYGSAEDVPEQIRNLSLHEDDTWDDAINTLMGNIWHQGNIFEATSYAIPFLIELLESDEPLPEAKAQILKLLELIRVGHCHHHSENTHEESEEWETKAHAAVDKGRNVYETLSKGKDAELRFEASELLDAIDNPDEHEIIGLG